MTVIEVVKKMGLEDFTKRYKNIFGKRVDTKYPLDILPHLEVKVVNINFITKVAEITILPHLEE